jgi:hypothetical protein
MTWTQQRRLAVADRVFHPTLVRPSSDPAQWRIVADQWRMPVAHEMPVCAGQLVQVADSGGCFRDTHIYGDFGVAHELTWENRYYPSVYTLIMETSDPIRHSVPHSKSHRWTKSVHLIRCSTWNTSKQGAPLDNQCHTVLVSLDVRDVLGLAFHRPDLHRGNSVRHWDVFVPLPLKHPDREDREAQALALCHTCPVLQPCRQWLKSTPRALRPEGVVAGQINRDHTPRRAG